MDANVHRLRLFRAVAEAGSLAGAAQRLFISEAAVSHQIKSLEQELSTRLFERGARGVRLTAVGEAIYRQAGVVLDAVERLLSVAHQRETPGQRVAVGVTRMGGLYHLTEPLRDFRRLRPDIALDVAELPSDEICGRMARGTLELGFVWGPVSSCLHLEKAEVSEDEAVLVTAPGPPRAAGGTAVPLAVVGAKEEEHPAACCSDAIERLVSAGDRRREVRPVASIDTAKKLAEAGLAVTVLPARTVLSEVRAGVLAATTGRSAPLQLTMLYPPASACSGAQRALIEFILDRSRPLRPREETPVSGRGQRAGGAVPDRAATNAS